MLEINDLNIKIDDRYLVKNLSFTLNYGDKLAIIGEEGNGKSTLLKAILGNCEYANIEGSINLHNNRIGYLEQVINNKYLDYKVFDYLFKNLNTYYDNITDFYKYSFVSIVLNWIDNGMHENPGLIVAKVSRLITGTIDHACLSVN